MQLTRLQLRNWRSYRNATFEFPASTGDRGKNVILVGAQNGVGKTSLLMALYLGLFGREATDLIEGFRGLRGDDDGLKSYRKLIGSILHRPSHDEEDPHCSVTLHFISSDEAQVTINRRWNFSRGGRVRNLDTADGEEVLIEIDGRRRAYEDWKEANLRIQDLIFPCNVMSCLFFDGEQAQARVEAAGGRALFDAVKTLYGTGILDQLGSSLRHYINNERNAMQRDIGVVQKDELDQKRDELDRKRDDLHRVEEKLTVERNNKTEAEQDRQELENRLYALVGDKATDIEEYGRAVSALQDEEAQLRQELISGIAALSLPLALYRKSSKLRDTLRSEQTRDRWLILKDEASSKASKIIDHVLPVDRAPDVVPPLKDEQTIQLRRTLAKALESLWSPPPQGCALDYRFPFLLPNDRASIISKLDRLEGLGAANLANTAVKLQSVETRLHETKMRFERVREVQPQLEELRNGLSIALEKQREAQNTVTGLESKERGLHSEIADLRGAIGQMERRQEAQNPIQQKLDVAQRLRSLIDDAKDKLIPLCKEALEERCTNHFRAMISDEYKRFSARFEADREPWLEGPNGQQVLVSTMSGAQKRAFGLAFSLAVADVSQQDAPIIIDTPVGNMDSAYRSRVLAYVAKAAAGQVIFLSHDEEIYGQYIAALETRLLKKMLVKFESRGEGTGISTVVDNKYFQ